MSDKPTIELELKMPIFPNFVKLEKGGNELTFSIGALTDEQLERYAEAWKKGLIEHAKSKRGAYKIGD